MPAAQFWVWCKPAAEDAREPRPSLQNLSVRQPPERSLVQICPKRTTADLLCGRALAGARASARAARSRLARHGRLESSGTIWDRRHNRTVVCPRAVSDALRSSQRPSTMLAYDDISLTLRIDESRGNTVGHRIWVMVSQEM